MEDSIGLRVITHDMSKIIHAAGERVGRAWNIDCREGESYVRLSRLKRDIRSFSS